MHPILLAALAIGGYFGFKRITKKSSQITHSQVAVAAINSATAAAQAAGAAQAAANIASNAASTAANHARKVISLKGISLNAPGTPLVGTPVSSTAGYDRFGAVINSRGVRMNRPPPPPVQGYRGRPLHHHWQQNMQSMQGMQGMQAAPTPQDTSSDDGSSPDDGSSSDDGSGDMGYERRRLRWTTPAHRVLNKRTNIIA